jgi:hypothetical protein
MPIHFGRTTPKQIKAMDEQDAIFQIMTANRKQSDKKTKKHKAKRKAARHARRH